MSNTPAPAAAYPASATPGQSAVAMIARQAIVNAQQAVIGYELFNRSRTGIGHTAATDVILVFTALNGLPLQPLKPNCSSLRQTIIIVMSKLGR